MKANKSTVAKVIKSLKAFGVTIRADQAKVMKDRPEKFQKLLDQSVQNLAVTMAREGLVVNVDRTKPFDGKMPGLDFDFEAYSGESSRLHSFRLDQVVLHSKTARDRMKDTIDAVGFLEDVSLLDGPAYAELMKHSASFPDSWKLDAAGKTRCIVVGKTQFFESGQECFVYFFWRKGHWRVDHFVSNPNDDGIYPEVHWCVAAVHHTLHTV